MVMRHMQHLKRAHEEQQDLSSGLGDSCHGGGAVRSGLPPLLAPLGGPRRRHRCIRLIGIYCVSTHSSGVSRRSQGT
jgi:hypothetical protein